MTQMYPPQPVQTQPKNGMGIAALTCGIIALLLCWFPLVNFASFVLGALAVIFGAVGNSRASKGVATNKGMSLTGVLTGGVGFVASIVVFIAFIAQVDKSIDQLDKQMSMPEVPAATTTVPTPAAPVEKDQPVAPEEPAEPAGITDGTWVVGEQIEPGSYRTAGPAADSIGVCTWERLSGTSGGFQDFITGGAIQGPTTVTIKSSDAAFKTTGCQPWIKQ